MMPTTTQQDMMKAMGNETKIKPYRHRKPTSVHTIASETGANSFANARLFKFYSICGNGAKSRNLLSTHNTLLESKM
jgi:hypothetical protein